ncbi:hypothetical protein Hanom_Chr09g00767461 [Helianthus anomalus]
MSNDVANFVLYADADPTHMVRLIKTVGGEKRWIRKWNRFKEMGLGNWWIPQKIKSLSMLSGSSKRSMMNMGT